MPAQFAAPDRRELDRQPRAAGDIEETITYADAEPMVHRDVFTAGGGLAQCREFDGPTSPAFIHHLPRHGTSPFDTSTDRRS